MRAFFESSLCNLADSVADSATVVTVVPIDAELHDLPTTRRASQFDLEMLFEAGHAASVIAINPSCGLSLATREDVVPVASRVKTFRAIAIRTMQRVLDLGTVQRRAFGSNDQSRQLG
jgi:hypothetical protein